MFAHRLRNPLEVETVGDDGRILVRMESGRRIQVIVSRRRVDAYRCSLDRRAFGA